MATKYKGPLIRAYDRTTGALVNSTVSLYNPQGGGDVELMRQWHLKWLGDIGTVWNDFTGKGVSVGVYDEGVQSVHWDLDGNYDASKHVVIDGRTLDGGVNSGPHGTSVAGLIAAEHNGRGGVGVAYDASITGVDIFDPNSPIYLRGSNGAAVVSALRQANQFDVVNHSWGGGAGYGFVNSRSNPSSFSAVLADSFRYAAETGRDGLGTISVQAAGNGSVTGLDNYAAGDRHVILVGAYRQADGAATEYSNSGPHLLVSAPSSDRLSLGGTGIVTTDLLGTAGYNLLLDFGAASDYTDYFGGTSAAAPIVSGVVALMLDANENLGWRDVQNILAASAKMPIAFNTGPVNLDRMLDGVRTTAPLNETRFRLGGADADWNGGRMHFSNDYGYGAVDAYNAVRMAEVWGLFGEAKTSRNEMVATVEKTVGLTAEGADYILPATNDQFKIDTLDDFRNTPTSFKFQVAAGVDIEHVDLTIDYTMFQQLYLNDGTPLPLERFSDLVGAQIKLIAPDGTQAYIAPTSALDLIDGSTSFTFGLSGFRGVDSDGTWTLQFAALDFDDAFANLGGFKAGYERKLTINSLKMEMTGTAASDDDVYTYTNEFFDMLAIKGESARKTLTDTDGGTDWINAAAVSSDVNLSLVGGQSTSFDGDKAFTIGRSSVIEGAVTGDGNDTLTGNRFDNLLFGMRGNDTLSGGAGSDTLFGGTGMDKFLFDNKGTSGKDTILDWSKGDMIATQTALRGQAGNGTVTVAKTAMLLLDGLLSGDTVALSQNGGAVLQAQGQKDGYFWYSYLSGADLNPNDVIREVSFQPERTAAGDIANAATATTALADAGVTFAATADAHDSAFYLYDAMAGSMTSGVLLTA